MGKNQHVVPHNGEWAVRGEGNERVTSTHRTQQEAIDAARSIAQNQGSELVIIDQMDKSGIKTPTGKIPSLLKDEK